MKKHLIKHALTIAKNKLSLHPQFDCYPHYTFIIQDNKIVEWATNTCHEPPLHYGYHSRLDYRPKFHAELFAYKKARGLLAKKSFEILNIRLNKQGELKMSKPCESCHEFLTAMGCKRFYYSSEIGFLRLI